MGLEARALRKGCSAGPGTSELGGGLHRAGPGPLSCWLFLLLPLKGHIRLILGVLKN